MVPPKPPAEVFAFSVDPSLEAWNVPPRAWLAKSSQHFDGLAVAAVVFGRDNRVLLVQRAAHDSMPNLWEVPGGAADQEDSDEGGGGGGGGSTDARSTILGAAARELWEEAGLVAARFTHLVRQPAEAPGKGPGAPAPPPAFADHPGTTFTNRRGSQLRVRIAFCVQVRSCAAVTLDPDEHQDYVWATEDEVREERLDSGRAIPVTSAATRAMILEAFRLQALQGASSREEQ